MEHVHDDGIVHVSDTGKKKKHVAQPFVAVRARKYTQCVCVCVYPVRMKRGRIRTIQMLIYTCVPDSKDGTELFVDFVWSDPGMHALTQTHAYR